MIHLCPTCWEPTFCLGDDGRCEACAREEGTPYHAGHATRLVGQLGALESGARGATG